MLAPGDTAKLEYAPTGKTYVIKLVRVELTLTKKP